MGANASLTTTGIRLVPALFGLATIALDLHAAPEPRDHRDPQRCFPVGRFARRGLPLSLLHPRNAVCFLHAGTRGGLAQVLRRSESGLLDPGGNLRGVVIRYKETAMISVGVLVIALVVTQVYRLFWTLNRRHNESAERSERGDYRTFFEKVGGSSKLTVWIVIALAVFVSRLCSFLFVLLHELSPGCLRLAEDIFKSGRRQVRKRTSIRWRRTFGG